MKGLCPTCKKWTDMYHVREFDRIAKQALAETLADLGRA